MVNERKKRSSEKSSDSTFHFIAISLLIIIIAIITIINYDYLLISKNIQPLASSSPSPSPSPSPSSSPSSPSSPPPENDQVCPLFETFSIQLRWDPNSEPDLAGYKLHIGTASRKYTRIVDVGLTTSYTFPLTLRYAMGSTRGTSETLFPGRLNFFAATAYNTAGLESGYSNEVNYPIPAIVAVSCGFILSETRLEFQIIMDSTSKSSQSYEFQTSTDLINWGKATPSSTKTENSAEGLYRFIYTFYAYPESEPQRYFRIKWTLKGPS